MEDKQHLAKKILRRIEREEHNRLIAKAAGFAAAVVGSLSLATFAYFDLMAEASRSGLWSFVSLFFSDFSTIVANFSDFAYSVMESFPIFSAILLLCGVFFTIWSAARFANEIMLMRGRKFSLLH